MKELPADVKDLLDQAMAQAEAHGWKMWGFAVHMQASQFMTFGAEAQSRAVFAENTKNALSLIENNTIRSHVGDSSLKVYEA